MSLSRLLRRKRASTRAILGDLYQEEVSDNPKVPVPPDSSQGIAVYTEERLKNALLYADQTLRNKTRKGSPSSNHCLLMYKSTVKAVLSNEWDTEKEKEEMLQLVLIFEKDIYTHRFLQLPSRTFRLGLPIVLRNYAGTSSPPGMATT